MTADGLYKYAIHDTISGDYLAPVDLPSNSMGRAVNGGKSGQSTMYPQKDWSRAQFREHTTPWARMLVKSLNDVPLAAQMITGRKWDFTRGNLELRHADIWSILSKRTTFGTNGYSGNLPADNNLPLLNQSLVSMPAWMIWAGTEGPTANFSLPIFLPEGKVTYALINSLPHSGTDSRTIWDYEVVFVDDAIGEVIKMPGGPDLDFQPRISAAGKLELLMRVGALTGSTSDWMMSSAEPGLFDVTHDEDAVKQTNVVYAIGKGAEADMRVRTAQASPTVPALERAVNYKEIDDLGILQSHANADLALFNQPINQWAASMLATAGKGIENMPPGHTMRLSFTDHPWEPDGFQPQRLIGFDTNQSSTVNLSLQPTGGV